MGRRLLTVVLLIVATACAAATSGSDDLRATVSVEYLDVNSTLVFDPQHLEYGEGSWATHEVIVNIGTDDYIQQFELHDSYALRDGRLEPVASGPSSEYVLSDEQPSQTSFTVELDDLAQGETRATFDVTVHLGVKPLHEGIIEPRDYVMTVELVYDVFLAEAPLTLFCAEAEQLLKEGDSSFVEPFLVAARDAGEAVPLSRFEAAAERYEHRADDDQVWDPNEFFDLTEDVCGVSYDERWISMA